MSKNRWAWCSVYFGQFVIWADFIKDEKGDDTEEIGDIKLVYPIPKRPAVSWNLTALTVEELDAVKDIIDTAFGLARPYCEQRDKEAADAFAEGDDSHSRIYRAVPQLVYREGPVREYREGLLDGPADAAGVPRGQGDPGLPVRDASSNVAQRDAGHSFTEDDWSEVDEPEEFRQVGEVGDGAERVQGADAFEVPPASPARPDVRPGEAS
jgi:hypothetical protein